FKSVQAQCDAVVVLGSDYTAVASPAELGYNARIAANLGAPVLLVLSGRDQQRQAEQLGTTTARTPEQVGQSASLAFAELLAERAELFAVVVNRADPDALDATIEQVRSAQPKATPVWAVPEDRALVAPSMRSILRAVDGRLVKGDAALLGHEAFDLVISGMSMVNVLPRITEGAVVIIAADRSEVLLATLLASA